MNNSGWVKCGMALMVWSLCSNAQAHVDGTTGWLHPLSGMDHLLAMISVGAWSCQMGRRAIWIVPASFVFFMFLGGLLGFEQIELPATEVGVSLSVVLLGIAIGLEKKLTLPLASLATGCFGIFHGYAHGYEMPVMENKAVYVGGFLLTTAMLHLIGAVGAHYLLKLSKGRLILRFLGGSIAVCGIYLTAQLCQ